MAKVTAVAVTCVATWLGVAMVIYQVGAATADEWRGVLGRPHGMRLLYLGVALTLPTISSVWVAFWLNGTIVDDATRARMGRYWRWLKWPVLAGYIVTAVFGSPTVHNSLGRSLLSGHVELGALPRCIPELDTYLALPLVPGVVLSYFEASSGCGTVWGAFYVHLWAGGFVTRLTSFQVWGGP